MFAILTAILAAILAAILDFWKKYIFNSKLAEYFWQEFKNTVCWLIQLCAWMIFSIFILQIGLNAKKFVLSLVSMQVKTRCFSNFPKVDFDIFFIWCSSCLVDVKSAKKPFVAINSRLTHFFAKMPGLSSIRLYVTGKLQSNPSRRTSR